MENKKDIYKKFCKANPVPVFSQYWWLDAVCGEDNWEVIIIKKGTNIVATMPYFIQKKAVFKTIYMPPLTQTMGPYIKYEEAQLTNSERKTAIENKIYSQIIKELPKNSFFFQNFHHSVTNWLAFYWGQYKQSSYYTYILDNIKEEQDILSKFTSAKRRQVKKAIKKSLTMKLGIDANTLYEHHAKTLAEQNQKPTYPKEILFNIVEKSQALNKGDIIGIKTPEGELLCCILLVWDENSAYNLVTSINIKSREYGASSFMFYEAIKYASNFVNSFDFEGSMVPNIENSYRQFGTKQVPYFRITKANNILLKIAEALHTSDAIK